MSTGIHPTMYLLGIAGDIGVIVVDIHAIKISRDWLESIVRPAASPGAYGCINMIGATRQIGGIHVRDCVLGLLYQRKVIGFRAGPTLTTVVGFIVNLIIIHTV